MKKLNILLLLFPVLFWGQSQEQNYIMTTAYKDSLYPAARNIKTVSYFDGLGKPIQQRVHGQSATGTDIVTHIEYDAQGRQAKDYLPYPSGNASLDFNWSANAETMAFYGTAQPANPGFETTQYPYSEKSFETSPLSRVLRQSAPGETWRLDPQGGADHSIKSGYSYNIQADNVRISYAIASTATNSNGYYDIEFLRPALKVGRYDTGDLYKTVIKNENWQEGQANPLANTTEEYKDKFGQVLLKRTYGESLQNGVPVFDKHDTYYVYDQYGNLSVVIPPMSEGYPEQLDQLCYQYRYDGRNRMVEKKLPGKPWEFIVYDKMDRVAATGPALNPFGGAQKGWLVNKYDPFGRLAYTAWYYGHGAESSAERNEMQRLVYDSTVKVEKRTGLVIINGTSINYTNAVFPTQSLHVLTINYYDQQSGGGRFGIPETSLGQNIIYFNKGLLTNTWKRILSAPEENTGIYSSIGYDYKQRPILNISENILGGYTVLKSKLDFSGKVLYSVTEHKKNADETPIMIREDFSYSAQDRLLTHTHQINGGEIHLMAGNTYDKLGQLVRKKVGGLFGASQPLQSIDYRYNIRGWLKEINDTQNLQQAGDPADLFAFKISYDTASDNVPGVKALFNGNISETYWRTAGDNMLRKYSYRYDDMNRLREALYQKSGQLRLSYNEKMDYDKNGNIRHLDRNGALDAQNAVIEIDQLEYFYDHPQYPNLLTKVFDHTAHPAGFRDDSPDGISDDVDDYAYDAFGNLTADQNKKISNITYNHLHLPVEILFDGGEKINYLYDAGGTKLRKTVTAGSAETVTEYAGGFQYEDGVLKFFPTAEGYVNNTVVNGADSFDYAYIYKDHLGNNRLTYGADRATGTVKVMEENHYYPYGLKHGSYNAELNEFQRQESAVVLRAPVNPNPGNGDASLLSFKYKYNGKEWQDELGLNMYAMDMRQYEPAIGRWVVQDPIVHHDVSPYTAFDNNPVFWADPSGADSQSGSTDGFGRDRFNSWGIYVPPFERFSYASPFRNINEDRNRRNSTANGNQSYNSGESTAMVNLPPVEITVNRDNWTGAGALAQMHVYRNSPFYESFWADSRSRNMDSFQSGLDYAGTVPVLGEIADGLNAGISLFRGDYTGAGLSLAAMVPFWGWGATATKIGIKSEKVYSVYHGLDESGAIKYVGITSRNPATRFAEHLNSVGTGKEFLRYRTIDGAMGLTKQQARILEQTLINTHGLQKNGGTLLNKINSISPTNWAKHGINP